MKSLDIENLKELRKEDNFNFNCDGCGTCCSNRNDILLRPYEIPFILKELEIDSKTFISKYCDVYVGSESKIPLISIKFRKKYHLNNMEVCPFLKFASCSIHKVKPSVCALYPLGRYISFPKKDADKNSESDRKIHYFVQNISCGNKTNKGNKMTLSKWLRKRNLEQTEDLFIQNSVFLENYHKLVSQVDFENLTEETSDLFFNSIAGILYSELHNVDIDNLYNVMKKRYDAILEITSVFVDMYKELQEAN